MSKQRAVPLEFEDEQLEHVFVGRRDSQARPTVILIPAVMGVSDLEIGFGRQLVELGYNALVADIFGKKFRGAPARGDVRRADPAEVGPSGAPATAARDPGAGAGPGRSRAREHRRRRLLLRRPVRARCRAERRGHLRGGRLPRACSTRPAFLRSRSRPRSSLSTAGTTRWSRPTWSSRSARS